MDECRTHSAASWPNFGRRREQLQLRELNSFVKENCSCSDVNYVLKKVKGEIHVADAELSDPYDGQTRQSKLTLFYG